MANSGIQEGIERCFTGLAQEARELFLDSGVPVLERTPPPLEFYRSYVAPNKPVVLSDFTASWHALHKWNHRYFRQVIGDLQVTVAVTPNGYADAVTDGYFVMPEERQMMVNQFLDIMEEPGSAQGVFYVQKQNSNLTEEFQTVMGDVETLSAWGTQVFGKAPDAVNMWIGDGRAVTSMHRDHYENLYSVVSGSKTFLLIPPSDLPFVPYESYPAAHYKEVNGQFVIEPDEEGAQVPWIAVDPLSPDVARYPQYANCRPVEVTVHAGQTLYLPSLWFHHVRQSHACVAVNLWYDMEFDIKYNYYKFVESVAQLVRKH
ncbi:bifunctional peptidase and (3S)-lysyl hydroxylase JMJD7-like isoform X2 [Littorina saxatilis]|uniref:Bifunctional peptidase and (3S)-lysyl hydroxylase JMJD7 n=1 Tax=Littorina saxatilis TaxID=31220 RepID=A0AAN9G7H9_9CAEN